MKKIAIISPYWLDEENIGRTRLERFARWLINDGYELFFICAGAKDEVEKGKYGKHIIVKDPLKLYFKKTKLSANEKKVRNPNKFRRFLAYFLFNPDPGIVWGWRAIKNSNVRNAIKNVDVVISSSPPESPHVVAYKLAKKNKKILIVDMRDGWLDDPLKSILKNSRIRKFREGILEKKILFYASKIFVTSEIWKDQLCSRYRSLENTVTVLTNGYPLAQTEFKSKQVGINKNLNLLYLGRFFDSRDTQKVSALLEPLLIGLSDIDAKGTISLIGKLVKEDYAELSRIKVSNKKGAWHIKTNLPVPKNKVKDELSKANGLLLLCISKSAIPSKVFEYIPTGKPILTVTPQNSAVWKLCEKIPQVYLIDNNEPATFSKGVEGFIEHCLNSDKNYFIPSQYTDENLSKIFLKSINF